MYKGKQHVEILKTMDGFELGDNTRCPSLAGPTSKHRFRVVIDGRQATICGTCNAEAEVLGLRTTELPVMPKENRFTDEMLAFFDANDLLAYADEAA